MKDSGTEMFWPTSVELLLAIWASIATAGKLLHLIGSAITKIRNFSNSPWLSFLPEVLAAAQDTCGLMSGDASKKRSQKKKEKKKTLRKLFCQMPKSLTCFISCQISSHKECFRCLFVVVSFFQTAKTIPNILTSSSLPPLLLVTIKSVVMSGRTHIPHNVLTDLRGADFLAVRAPVTKATVERSESGRDEGSIQEQGLRQEGSCSKEVWQKLTCMGGWVDDGVRVLGDLWSPSTAKTSGHFALTSSKQNRVNEKYKRFSCSFLNAFLIFPP